MGALGEADRSADLGGDGFGHLGAPLVVEVGEPTYGRDAIRWLVPAPGAGVKGGARSANGGLDFARPRRGDLRDGLLGVR